MPDLAYVDVLASLEARQEQLLRQLDELNERIEQALVTCVPQHEDRPPGSVEATLDTS